MASIFQSFSGFRRAAPRLSKEFLTCRATYASRSRIAKFALPIKNATPFFQSFRLQTTQAPRHASGPLSKLAGSIPTAAEGAARKSGAFPKTSEQIVAYWLLGSAVSVFGIVVFGGLTRLTESGLSITEWRPVTGSLPPFNSADWESEFTKYRASPEFAQLNSRMTLEEFKSIYWMEWIHRLWGRVIGVTFLLPTAYFIARKRVAPHMAWKLTGICGMIGVQGVIGWWMVASGLKDDLFAPGSHPRVSQYRLTAHLGAAFAVYCSMLWTGLSILKENRLLKDPAAGQAVVNALRNPQLRVLKGSVVALSALVFVTAMSGALVAGLDAGLIYNEFPWMGVGLAPPKKELWDPFYSREADHSDLWWRNLLENPSLVQLDHRILATATLTAVSALFAWPRMSSKLMAALPRNAKRGITGCLHVALFQVVLGISTLIYMVPTWLGAAHQAGALALLTGTVLLAHRLRVSPRTVRLLQEALKRAGAKSSPASVKPGVGTAARTTEQKVV